MRHCVALVRSVYAAALLLLAPQTAAQVQAPEPELKAAILANMLLFIDWPPKQQASERLLLCHLGDSSVASALAQLDGKLIKGKTLQVLRVDTERSERCHALYFSPADENALNRVAPGLRAAGVLLAADTPGFLQRGAMLNLELVAGRVVFDIDLRSTRQAGLAVSSKVLRLARQVVE